MGLQPTKLSAPPRGAGQNPVGRTMVLPFQALARPASTTDATDLRLPLAELSDFEVETVRLNNTGRSSPVSTSTRRTNRYIKRYRSEEEKLVDMLKEKETVLAAAIKQGQQLRAKCNRYKEELDSLKAISNVDMTDQLWKKKYSELDKKYRDLKEEMDVMVARNKNGRDYLRQQNETIAQLTMELQQEKVEKQQVISTSLPSLQGIGVSDKKGKLAISKLRIDKQLMEERIQELTQRNQRGRDYVSKLEADTKEQDAIISRLKAQLLQEKAEKEALMLKSGPDIPVPATHVISVDNTDLKVTTADIPTYAKVNKNRRHAESPTHFRHETSPALEPVTNHALTEPVTDDLSPTDPNTTYAQVNKVRKTDESSIHNHEAPHAALVALEDQIKKAEETSEHKHEATHATTNGVLEEVDSKSIGFDTVDIGHNGHANPYEEVVIVNPIAKPDDEPDLPEGVEHLQTGTEASINFDEESPVNGGEAEIESPRTDGSSSLLSSEQDGRSSPTAEEHGRHSPVAGEQGRQSPVAGEQGRKSPDLDRQSSVESERFHYEPMITTNEECTTRF